MKRSRVLLAATAVAIVAGGAGTASGAALRTPGPVSSGVISGCWSTKAVKGSHVLVLQDADTSCPRGTTPISWNQTGPAGENGVNGVNGSDGLSAYEIWLQQGHAGTVDAFLASLVGATGADGADGAAGSDGRSAFQIWQQLPGNDGKSVADFFAALKGDTGDTGSPGPAGPAGPALTSLDDLNGVPCRVGTPQEGTLTVTYAADGSLALTCGASTRYTLTVNLAGSGIGSVTSSPAGLTCSGATCTGAFASGTPVTLTATPNGIDRFVGWSGDCTNASGTCAVAMSAGHTVTASFTAMAHLSVTVSNSVDTGSLFTDFGSNYVLLPNGQSCAVNGSLTSNQCSITVPVGPSATLSRGPASHNPLDHWTGCAAAGSNCSVSVPGRGDYFVEAAFSDQ